MKLKTKLQLLVAVVVVAMAFLQGAAWFTLRAEHRAEEFTQVTEAIDRVLLNMRRHEKDFEVRKDDASLQAWTVLADDAARLIAEARQKALALGYDSMDARLEASAAGLTDYTAAFKRIVQATRAVGVTPETGLLGELRASIHAAEQIFLKADNDGLAKDMLMLRRNEKDFLARLDEKYVKTFEQNLAELSARTAASTLAPQAKAEAAQRIETYRADFLAVAAKLREIGLTPEAGLRGELRKSAHSIEQQVAAMTADGRATAAASSERMVWIAAILSIGASLAICGWLLHFSSGLSRRVTAITGCMGELSRGNYDAEVPPPSPDELGVMVQAVADWRDAAAERRRMAEAEKQAMAERLAAQTRRGEATERFSAAIVDLLASVKRSIEDMHDAADVLSGNAERSSTQSATVSAATQQANSSIQAVASAATELHASIDEIARHVERSTAIAQDAAREAETATTRITGLAEAVNRIGEIVNLINDIAGQTNLLALNATIESARAGEAGKGFAVVANEVKHLAGQTARATGDIASQIADIQAQTRGAVEAINGVAGIIVQMNSLSTVVAGAVEEQGAATAEIARSVEHASTGTHEVAENIDGVANSAAETGRMAQNVLDAASRLIEQSSGLERAVTTFVAEIRAS
ncbi:MAG: methyl-accepting chemotaxis protein [Solirubrobacterales bacterium]